MIEPTKTAPQARHWRATTETASVARDSGWAAPRTALADRSRSSPDGRTVAGRPLSDRRRRRALVGRGNWSDGRIKPPHADQTSRHALGEHTPASAFGGASSQFLYTRHWLLSATLTRGETASRSRCLSARIRQTGLQSFRAYSALHVPKPRGAARLRQWHRAVCGAGSGWPRPCAGRRRSSTASSLRVPCRGVPRRSRFTRDESPGRAAASPWRVGWPESSGARATAARDSRQRCHLIGGRCSRHGP